jgi:hypothetical protein
MHRSTVLVVIAAFSSWLSGCLDAAPINLASQDAGLSIDAGEVHDGEVSADAYPHPECRACIAADPSKGPGCGDHLETCRTGAARCIDVYECAYRRGCVTKPTYGESIACAIPCAGELGITDVNTPDIQLAIRLTQCFHDPNQCAKVCEVSAATSF